jgi:hypothetical protein
MEQEKELTSQESLELITRMIRRAKDDYRETGISALLCGGDPADHRSQKGK